MKKVILLLLSMLAVIGCGCHKRCLQVDQRDSTVIHVIDSTVYHDSTILVPVPFEGQNSIVGPSDTSHLETSVATSDAWYDGTLHHTLNNKHQATLPYLVHLPEHIHSELEYKDRLVIQKVEVEKKLTKWQSFRMKVGGWAITLALLAIIGLIYKMLGNK